MDIISVYGAILEVINRLIVLLSGERVSLHFAPQYGVPVADYQKEDIVCKVTWEINSE